MATKTKPKVIPGSRWRRSGGSTVENRPERIEADDPTNPFHGARATAEGRVRALADLACKHLATHALNLASYHISTYLDVTLGTANYTKAMMGELKQEKKSVLRRQFAKVDGDKRRAGLSQRLTGGVAS